MPKGKPQTLKGSPWDPSHVPQRAKLDEEGKPVLDAKGRPVAEPIPKTDADGTTPKSRRMG